jgi:phage-related holin
MKLAQWFDRHILEVFFGQFFAFFAYFSEMKNVFHLLFIAFVADFVVGTIHSIKIDKIKFSMSRFYWHVLGRMVIVFFLIMMLYAGDKEMKVETGNLANYVAYFVFGMLLISFSKNANELTGNKLMLLKIIDIIEKKIKDIFGVDVETPSTADPPTTPTI